MKAEIFAIGTELLMGELSDTNGSWIASKLPPLGIQVDRITGIGDNLEALTEAFVHGIEKVDFIFTTGGLGPTQDDLTREAVALAVGETATIQKDIVQKLQNYFESRGTPMPQANIKQANLIPSARFIDNPNGTAPGWWTEKNGTHIICMPGPPTEMHPMWENEIEPNLRTLVNDEVTLTRNVKTIGMSESAIDEIMDEFFGNENPYLGIYSKADGIHLRIIARAADQSSALELIKPVENAINDRLGDYIWGYDDDTPALCVGRELTQRKMTLSIADCCTGGFLSDNITHIPESTSFLKGSIISPTPRLLDKLKLTNKGPDQGPYINPDFAQKASETIRETLDTDFGLAIIGVLGPDELENTSVGQVYISISGHNQQQNISLKLPPRRLQIKRRASNTALTELLKIIKQTNQ